MSLGPIMLDLEGQQLNSTERELLQHPLVGGVILFSRNYSDLEQLTELVSAIHAVRSPHLLVAVDHEGGRVQRFREGFTRLPPARRIGVLYDTHHQRAKDLAHQCGWLMGSELRSVGIDFSFAPVVDLDYGQSGVIGDRAFHRDPEAVYELAYAYMQGMRDAGMAAVAKHFPGHGAVSADSHVAIPVDERDFALIYQQDILPFRKLIQNNVAAIMPAHVIYEKVDTRPAGFSRKWLQDVLRRQLHFSGVIFSDDLSMQGASVAGEHYHQRAQAALAAGCDVALVCNNRAGALDILNNLQFEDNPVQHARLARLHGRHELTRQTLNASRKWHVAVEQIQKYLDDPSLELKLS